jgi:hypothetical protein
MKWIKKGLIYKPNKEFEWQQDRAIAPLCELTEDNRLRIYFSSRDMKGRSTPVYLEANPERPEEIYGFSEGPILDLGPQGSFDDNGILSSSLVRDGNRRFLYYVGWNPRVNVSYHLSIGLAISEGNGPFVKIGRGPILDRGIVEPFFNTAPFVLKTGDGWKMWYVSCTGWKMINNYPEPLYNIKYATSPDGINWVREGKVAIETDDFAEAIGKPCVYFEDGVYKMFYSYRNSIDYRTDPDKSYRLGYAESDNGIDWKRMDDKVGIERSKEGWDSVMMEYCSTYVFKGKRYLVYNGNGFGESGFGYAVLAEGESD